MGPGRIPIYPKPNDLVLLIDTIIDVAGTYSRGILYRFGTQLGERYGNTLREEGLMKGCDIGPFLGMLSTSGWFKSYTLSGNECLFTITVTEPFEEESRARDCDFLRGFLAGMGTVFTDLPTYYEEEKNDGKVIFRGRMGEEE